MGKEGGLGDEGLIRKRDAYLRTLYIHNTPLPPKHLPPPCPPQKMVIGGHTVNMIKRIAEGGFSEVYLARDAAASGGSGEEEYAVKWIVAQVRRVCVVCVCVCVCVCVFACAYAVIYIWSTTQRPTRN